MNKSALGLAVVALGALFLLRGSDGTGEASAPDSEALMNADASTNFGGYFLVGTAPQNVSAFLHMLQSSEHVYPRDVENQAAYSTFYGGSTFSSFADHPVNTREKVGVRLSDAQCRASGFKPGCVSTAAGAYQFIKPTWDRIRAMSPRLPDFSPASQDAAAVRLLDQIGALTLIEVGDIEGAVTKASKTWASLPGSKAQQNPRQMAFIIDRFNEAVA
jgi:lysozyme